MLKARNAYLEKNPAGCIKEHLFLKTCDVFSEVIVATFHSCSSGNREKVTLLKGLCMKCVTYVLNLHPYNL